MAEHPGGVRLLDLARRALIEDLSPVLPPEHRHNARLAAKAMEIAAGELAAGTTPREAERAALARLLPDDPGESEGLADTETLDEILRRLSWRLAAEIRAGRRDADVLTHEVLVETARARLAMVKRRDQGKQSGDA